MRVEKKRQAVTKTPRESSTIILRPEEKKRAKTKLRKHKPDYKQHLKYDQIFFKKRDPTGTTTHFSLQMCLCVCVFFFCVQFSSNSRVEGNGGFSCEEPTTFLHAKVTQHRLPRGKCYKKKKRSCRKYFPQLKHI